MKLTATLKRLKFFRHGLESRGFLLFLVCLDLFMAISATYIDWGDFFEVPWYLILFVPICPIYPLLLAINFWKFWRTGEFSQPLLHFTLIGTIGYGIMAYIFYPTYLISEGFGWYEFGNIFWVTLYALQTLLLLPHLEKISFALYAPMLVYFLAKDFLDRFGDTFSYHRAQIFSEKIENFLFVSILFLHLFAFLFILLRAQNVEFRSRE